VAPRLTITPAVSRNPRATPKAASWIIF
jgi:hypothetical protein